MIVHFKLIQIVSVRFVYEIILIASLGSFIIYFIYRLIYLFVFFFPGDLPFLLLERTLFKKKTKGLLLTGPTLKEPLLMSDQCLSVPRRSLCQL